MRNHRQPGYPGSLAAAVPDLVALLKDADTHGAPSGGG